jgi:hypothetical protein
MPRIVALTSDVAAAPGSSRDLPWRGNDIRLARATPEPGVRGYPCLVSTRIEFVPSARSRAHIHRYCRVSALGDGIGASSGGYGESADLQAET